MLKTSERNNPTQAQPLTAGREDATATTSSAFEVVSGLAGLRQLSRRRLLRTSVGLGISSLAAASVPPGTAAVAAGAVSAVTSDSARRPDFVVVVIDDMRSSDWQALPQTRQLLGDRGVTFPNFFTTTPGCSPSRASILTGLYAHEHGVWLGDDKDAEAGITSASVFEKLGLPERTIAVSLQDAGYRTALVGKYLNRFGLKHPIPVGWDDWYSTSSTDYVDFELNENGEAVKYRGDDQYVTDILAAKAVETIEATPAVQPLFLYFAPKAPHAPSTPAKRHMGEFKDAHVETDPSVGETDVSDKPAFLQGLALEDMTSLNAEERMRLQSLLAVDEAVVRIVGALETAGRLDNTYIFVLSDNGYAMGQHRWLAKGLPYDTVTRIPMIACGPELEAGVIDERLVANCDIAPTLAALSGATPGAMSGSSLLGEDVRSVVLLENRPVGGAPGYRALRDADFLYVEWDSGERELYDYRTDPFELDNALADWEGHTPQLAALDLATDLHDRLDLLATCSGSACQEAERAPIGV